MGFASGSVSFRRFLVVGKQPKSFDQALLDKLADGALKPSEFGVPARNFGAQDTSHVKLNDNLGQPDDPATKAVAEFLGHAMKK